MSTYDDRSIDPVRVATHHAVTKRLGHWTTQREFVVRAQRGKAVLDLRSPQIADGDLHLDVELEHATLTLLVADDATVEDWELRRAGRARVKNSQPQSAPASRRVVLTGQIQHSEIRIQRGGVAMLSAMCSREYLADLRRAHRLSRYPSVDDPTRTA
jgi:hypothetical protein